jgi:hypothetical protein
MWKVLVAHKENNPVIDIKKVEQFVSTAQVSNDIYCE